jgi:LysR family transcriptional regulator, nitrogen assimilation regulatory protein
MDVRQLRYFVCIAELGSLSAASNRLGIAQPSLSHHVKHLEEELGVELVVRSPRGVSLTESGHVLLAHANTILSAVETAVTDLRDRASEPRGPVSFALPSSAGNVLSVPLAEAIRKRFPRIMLRAMDAMSGHVQEWVTEGAIDLGILYDVNAVRHLRLTPLLVEEMFLVVPGSGRPGEVGADGICKAPVSFAECASFGLILPHRTHGLRETIERYASAHGVNLQVILEMDALTHIKSLVTRGSGYSILAHAAVAEEAQRGDVVLIPIRDPVIRRTVYLARNPSRPVTRAALEVERVTIDIIRDLVRKKVWRGELSMVDRAPLPKRREAKLV